MLLESEAVFRQALIWIRWRSGGGGTGDNEPFDLFGMCRNGVGPDDRERYAGRAEEALAHVLARYDDIQPTDWTTVGQGLASDLDIIPKYLAGTIRTLAVRGQYDIAGLHTFAVGPKGAVSQSGGNL